MNLEGEIRGMLLRQMGVVRLKKLFGVLGFGSSLIVAIAVFTYGTISSIHFEQNCRGYLKRAADSNTIQLAQQELQKAVTFLEESDLTSGSTHLIYQTPSCDLGFWYTNLRVSLDELNSMPTDVDRMTTSNQLLKLRETIMDTSKNGTKVTVPRNAHLFPNQLAVTTLGFGCFAGLSLSTLSLISDVDSANCTSSSSV